MSRVSLKDRLQQKAPALFEAIYNDFRPKLDTHLAVLDLSFSSLKLSEKDYKLLSKIIRQSLAGSTYPVLEDPRLEKYFTNKSNLQPVLIDRGVNQLFIVGNNLNEINNFIVANVSKDPRLADIQVGNTEDKTAQILSVVNSSSNSRIVQLAKKTIQNIQDVKLDLSLSLKNTAYDALLKAKSLLSTAYISLTLTTANQKQQLTRTEQQLYSKFVAESVLSLGSDTLVEPVLGDIETAIVNSISDKPVFKKQEAEQTSKTSKKKTRKVNTDAGALKLSKQKFTTPSLVSLELLINKSLYEQVKSNMGTGSARNVLNFRTGRLARSAKLERMLLAKSGAITAFYSYMRRPYGTFSEGGAQQYPRSRDPKLLISKSIKELAGAAVASRMRTVLV